MPAHWNAEQHTEPMAAPRLRSLFECLGEVPECRHDRGKRYPLNTILALAVAARLAGYRGVNAFAQFAALLSQEQLEAVGAFWSPSKQRSIPAPIGVHMRRRHGQDLRGASKQTEDGRRMMVAAVEHDSGMVGGGRQQEQRNPGRTRALQQPRPRRPHCHRRCDARPARDGALPARAPRRLRDQRHQGQSGNHPRRPQAIDFSDGTKPSTTSSSAALSSTSPAPNGRYANLHGRRQAMRIEREREILKTGKPIEVLEPHLARPQTAPGPEELLALGGTSKTGCTCALHTTTGRMFTSTA